MTIIPDTRPTAEHLPPTCPPWCQLPPGHDLDDPAQLDRDGSLYVEHVALIATTAGGELTITQTEVLGGPEPGPGSPRLLVAGAHEYEPGQVAELAAGYALAVQVLGGAT